MVKTKGFFFNVRYVCMMVKCETPEIGKRGRGGFREENSRKCDVISIRVGIFFLMTRT